jgi:D-beta-D-heptose 7-phosphate kinase/D-beta-D-heptose 1-phosphate adenosyltransferase|tara:strand:+ start:74 stop:592 length:519 start_codon:yes stop_codon:yes gene_type:complete
MVKEINKWLRVYNTLEEIKIVLNTIPNNKIVVYTYGVWDLLHPGHIKLLTRAKNLGDFLIVGVVKDEPVRELKGLNRPIQPLHERLYNVGALRCVDAAIVQNIYDPSAELKSIKKVDILTKGNDWINIPGKSTIESLGGKLVKLSYSDGHSTSSLVSKISGKKVAKHGEPKC